MTQEKHSAAKYTFYYLLALIALLFTAIGIGQIVFQIINICIPETTFSYYAIASQAILRFGISSIIVTSPIFYFLTRRINKDLEKKVLDKDSGIRKWLTYVIIFISSCIAIGFFISILHSFLSGEITTQFIFKALTAIILSAIAFSYYFYDIKRVKLVRDRKIKIFGILFVLIILGSLVAGLYFVDSPIIARQIKEDSERVNNLNTIHYSIEDYYYENKILINSLDNLENRVLIEETKDPVTNEVYEYNKISKKSYEICATFNFSNKEESRKGSYYIDPQWLHEEGHQCFEKKIVERY